MAVSLKRGDVPRRGRRGGHRGAAASGEPGPQRRVKAEPQTGKTEATVPAQHEEEGLELMPGISKPQLLPFEVEESVASLQANCSLEAARRTGNFKDGFILDPKDAPALRREHGQVKLTWVAFHQDELSPPLSPAPDVEELEAALKEREIAAAASLSSGRNFKCRLLEGQDAQVAERLDSGRFIYLSHVVVPEKFRGAGLAARFIRAVLDECWPWPVVGHSTIFPDPNRQGHQLFQVGLGIPMQGFSSNRGDRFDTGYGPSPEGSRERTCAAMYFGRPADPEAERTCRDPAETLFEVPHEQGICHARPYRVNRDSDELPPDLGFTGSPYAMEAEIREAQRKGLRAMVRRPWDL